MVARADLEQVSVQDLLAAAGTHVLAGGSGGGGAGGGGGGAHRGCGRGAGGRAGVVPLHGGPLGLSVRLGLHTRTHTLRNLASTIRQPVYFRPYIYWRTDTAHLHSSPHTRHLFILVLCTNPRICEN